MVAAVVAAHVAASNPGAPLGLFPRPAVCTLPLMMMMKRNQAQHAALSGTARCRGRRTSMTSPRDRWSAPVEIDFVTTGKQHVNGPFEALVWLTDRWPCQQGIRFVMARSACRGALAGHTSLETAREMFQSAVEEAGGNRNGWSPSRQWAPQRPLQPKL